MDIPKIRREIDQLMTEKLKLLTPQIVKRVRSRCVHLAWALVVRHACARCALTGSNALDIVRTRCTPPHGPTQLMESVVRKHLGWLIVWGNVFGGLIGVIAHGVGYGQG